MMQAVVAPLAARGSGPISTRGSGPISTRGMASVSPPSRPVGSIPAQVLSVPPGTPSLTLTERQSIPRVVSSAGDVSKLPIDHRAGFLLAHVDGMQTLEELLDVCAMPAAEALELFAKLKAMGVVEFE
jgi:hypothetical protein